MKRKYETRCWLCGSNDLEPDDREIHCQSCDATFNAILNPGVFPLTTKPDPAVTGQSGSPGFSRKRPDYLKRPRKKAALRQPQV